METEIIVCRTCGLEHSITKAVLCPVCREEINTDRELLDRISEKQNQANTLVAEIAAARSELYFRKLRSKEIWFWETPKASLKLGKTNGKPARLLINLDDLD